MSRFQGFLKYLTTENGKLTSLYCVFSFGAGCVALRWLPHNFCLPQYREFIACYKDGFERSLPDRIKKRFEKAMDILEMDELERTRTKMFCVSGFDTFHAGSKHTVFGSLIGVPVNYMFEKASDIPRSDIVVNGERVKWDTDAGKMFEESLLVDEKEQIFGICREILHTRTLEMPLNCLYPLVTTIMGYAMASIANRRLKLFEKPLGLRMVLYTLVGLFSYGNYSLFTDYTHCRQEIKVDKQLAELGEDMAKAGASYYDKILKRNLASRILSGDNSLYSATGNLNQFLRQRTIPLSVRKDFFQSKLEEMNAQ